MSKTTLCREKKCKSEAAPGHFICENHLQGNMSKQKEAPQEAPAPPKDPTVIDLSKLLIKVKAGEAIEASTVAALLKQYVESHQLLAAIHAAALKDDSRSLLIMEIIKLTEKYKQ